MTKKIIEIEDIGSICLQKHKTAKHLRIILRPGKTPKVTVPRIVPYKAAELFARSKRLWIKETLKKLEEAESGKQKISPEETELLRKKAKNYLPGRVEELAERHGLSYNRVFVKNLKSRWGSCSSKNNINLNLHLMRLPEPLVDYVILHELAHTKEKNHGKGFRNLLNSFVADSRVYDKELKNYSSQVP